jgi:hypothetical protein
LSRLTGRRAMMQKYADHLDELKARYVHKQQRQKAA